MHYICIYFPTYTGECNVLRAIYVVIQRQRQHFKCRGLGDHEVWVYYIQHTTDIGY